MHLYTIIQMHLNVELIEIFYRATLLHCGEKLYMYAKQSNRHSFDDYTANGNSQVLWKSISITSFGICHKDIFTYTRLVI